MNQRNHIQKTLNAIYGDSSFVWDANGNMTHHTNPHTETSRLLCWDEENRLTAVRDQNHLSAYIYDAGGERVWKLTGQVQQMHMGGDNWINVVDMNNKTLYVSSYMVYNETSYSKHYYAGIERISSRIGGGLHDALQAEVIVDPLTFTVEHLSPHDDYAEISSDLLEMLNRNITCVEMDPSYVSMEESLHSVEQSTHQSDPEDNRYIYHSDHLGSSAFLTNLDGDPTQHLQYLPFGEPFIEQRSVTDYYTPYTFSAKERDLETGYSFFGARYYSSTLSIWLSVDPMADKYPSMSPYMYCAGNPVILVDPDGRRIRFSLYTRLFDRAAYNAYNELLKTEAGINAFAPYMTKRQAKRYHGSSDAKAGELSRSTKILFSSKRHNDPDYYGQVDATINAIGHRRIELVDAYKHPAILDRKNPKTRITFWLFNSSSHSHGYNCQTLAHEVGLHFNAFSNALQDVIYNSDMSPAKKSSEIWNRFLGEKAEDIHTSLDPWVHHDHHEHFGSTSLYQQLSKEFKIILNKYDRHEFQKSERQDIGIE